MSEFVKIKNNIRYKEIKSQRCVQFKKGYLSVYGHVHSTRLLGAVSSWERVLSRAPRDQWRARSYLSGCICPLGGGFPSSDVLEPAHIAAPLPTMSLLPGTSLSCPLILIRMRVTSNNEHLEISSPFTKHLHLYLLNVVDTTIGPRGATTFFEVKQFTCGWWVVFPSPSSDNKVLGNNSYKLLFLPKVLSVLWVPFTTDL